MLRVSKGRKIFDICNMIFLGILGVIFAYPYFLCIGSSFASNASLVKHGFSVIPKEWSLEAYKIIFTNEKLSVMHSFWISVKWTIIATVLTVTISGLYAYPVSRENFKGKTFLNVYCMFTMVFSGGTIATYLIVSSMLYDTLWAVVIPGAMNVWYMFLMRNYFTALPVSLQEAAELDGAGALTVFVKIYIPLSKPIVATIALYSAVGFWNNYTGPLMYLKTTLDNVDKFPIPLVINQLQFNTANYMENAGGIVPTSSIQAACVVVSTLPIVCVYPFLQKYFINGVMMGAVKE
jgi:putative aldouronate transport system permease protein